MKIIKTHGKYTGNQIAPGWAYTEFKLNSPLNKNEDSIVVMRGSMDVTKDEMVDLEDLKNNEEIKGSDLIHFIIEHYDTNKIEISYLRQRLFTCLIYEALTERGIKVNRRGDDLFIDNKKLTVSVATSGKNSIKFHFGVNVTSEGTPDYVDAIGLNEIGFNEIEIKNFVCGVCRKYIREIEKIKKDILKTKVF